MELELDLSAVERAGYKYICQTVDGVVRLCMTKPRYSKKYDVFRLRVICDYVDIPNVFRNKEARPWLYDVKMGVTTFFDQRASSSAG